MTLALLVVGPGCAPGSFGGSWSSPDVLGGAAPVADGAVAGVDAGAPVAQADARPTPDVGADGPPPCVNDCSPMVWVPGGTFMMGAKDIPGESRPRHPVTLSHGYWLDKYEVSKKRYKACVDAGACPEPTCCFTTADDTPVRGLTWQAARAYCTWAGKRLPTEAEWEHAACGDGTRCYPWGGTQQGAFCSSAPTCAQAAHCPDSQCKSGPCYRKPQPVGTFEGAGNRSAYGAVNMAGNVWEWVADPWTPDFKWCASGCTDPVAPGSNSAHVFKGGAWISEEVFLRCAARYHDGPGGFPITEVGVRCARDPR